MKKIRLAELINSLDDEIVENVLEMDTPQRLKEKKEKERYMKNKKIMKWAIGLACVAVFGIGMLNGYNETKKQKEEAGETEMNTTVVNPIIECSSLEEMNSLLDFEVPALDKDVEFYIALDYDADGHGEHGRIRYSDGTQFEMEETIGDISGIYGGEMVKTETIDGMNVEFYNAEEYNYIIWNDGTYSYSYSKEGTLEESEVIQIVDATASQLLER